MQEMHHSAVAWMSRQFNGADKSGWRKKVWPRNNINIRLCRMLFKEAGLVRLPLTECIIQKGTTSGLKLCDKIIVINTTAETTGPTEPS